VAAAGERNPIATPALHHIENPANVLTNEMGNQDAGSTPPARYVLRKSASGVALAQPAFRFPISFVSTFAGFSIW